jgi:pseudouridine-5'-phosphate glycosidase
MSELLHIQPIVEKAITKGQAVVALESTVITHGLPYPDNVQAARSMEEAIIASGATPATIAIIQGEIYIGLSADQLDFLGRQGSENVRKCSRRDLAAAAALGENGGTTVAGTMILAHLAEIEIFATGGIGGVHRGHPFDVSADLAELGRTPVTVICGGPKSILDLALTREVLETNGVPVIGYQTNEMPAFYSRHSGLGVDARVDNAVQAAELILKQRQLGLQSGILITVPVPEEDALDASVAEEAIIQATREADEAGISGPTSTPWLLQRVKELTDGESLKANVSLLKNNARTAGAIASALAELKSRAA